jgi:8-oxo-dGTP pyrophosphatase MutT (NUDIX family)
METNKISDKETIPKILLLKAAETEEIIKLSEKIGFFVYLTDTTEEAIKILKSNNITVIISALGLKENHSDNWEPLIKESINLDPKIFNIIFSFTASNNATIRYECFKLGSNMVTNCLVSLKEALTQIRNQFIKPGAYDCPICGFKNLTEDNLWIHLPLYHINLKNSQIRDLKCTFCNKKPNPNLQVHYRNAHGPCGRREIESEFEREHVELYAFSLVVVHRKEDNKFLLIQEFATSGYWLPGGGVDGGEDLLKAGIRETKEEGGIDVKITGLLTFQFNHSTGRLRVIYYGEPVDANQKPKSLPDYESCGAVYASYEELKKLELRGDEPLIWIKYVIDKKTIYPLDVFSQE